MKNAQTDWTELSQPPHLTNKTQSTCLDIETEVEASLDADVNKLYFGELPMAPTDPVMITDPKITPYDFILCCKM